MSYSIGCDTGYWITHRGQYARVVTPHPPAHCVGKACGFVHPPRPLLVRTGNKIAVVPPHPNDVPGKPPLNLKNAIIMASFKPGQSTERVAEGSTQSAKILGKSADAAYRDSVSQTLRAEAPDIRAHLLQEAIPEKLSASSAHSIAAIKYDYKSRNFVMPDSRGANVKAKSVLLGGINSHGKIDTFVSSHSSRYASSFAHSSEASSYRGGDIGSGHAFGSSVGGGGFSAHAGGSSSAGSHSSGSFGGGSSGGGHSSGGGGMSASGASGGGASSGGGGGRAH